MTHETQLNLVGISGSLRKGSYATSVLLTLKSAFAHRFDLRILSLDAIPFYNADVEADGLPQPVAEFKSAIQTAKGVVIVTPEYNYSIPGVLKNALDWASRPAYKSPFKHKPVFVISTSPGAVGGVRAQSHLRDVLSGMLAIPAPVPEISIPAVHTKIVDGRLTDELSLKLIRDSIDVFLGRLGT